MRSRTGSEFVISEDKDLLRLRQDGAARIVRAVDFLALGRRRWQRLGHTDRDNCTGTFCPSPFALPISGRRCASVKRSGVLPRRSRKHTIPDSPPEGSKPDRLP